MRIGVPKERKNHEYRTGLTPQAVKTLVHDGHEVIVETNLGEAIGFSDEDYSRVGAQIKNSAKEIFQADLIIKVKEIIDSEFDLLHEGQILFTFLHLAADRRQTERLLEKKVIAFAYETVTDDRGALPLLVPMSEIAGRLSVQIGASFLQLNHGGPGLLLGGVPGVLPGHVIVIGGGVAGLESARMAMGLGAKVTVIDKKLSRLREIDQIFGHRIQTLYASDSMFDDILLTADLVIGAVLIPGKSAPKIITRDHLRRMAKGSVLVDISIDQGGIAETSRPTSHANPTFIEEGVIHYCVTNIPGAVARTSTLALTNATLEYSRLLANKGWKGALMESKGMRSGLNLALGTVNHLGIAQEQGYEYVPPEQWL